MHMYSPEMVRSASDMNHYTNGSNNGVDSNDHSRTSSRNGNHHNGHGTIVPKRNAPRNRSAWSYGPGAGMGGYTYNMPPAPPISHTDNVGPRLTPSMRRTSGASNAGGSAGARTPGDEASSTAVSSLSRF